MTTPSEKVNEENPNQISSSSRVSSGEIVAIDNTNGSSSSSSFNNTAAIVTTPNERVNEANPKPIFSPSRVSPTENTNDSSSSLNNSATITTTTSESVNEANPKPISSSSIVSPTEIAAIDNTNGSSSLNNSAAITTTPNESVNEANPKPISSSSPTEIAAIDNTNDSSSLNNSAAITNTPNESVNEANPKPISSSSPTEIAAIDTTNEIEAIDNTNGSSSSFNNSAAITTTPNESVNEANPKPKFSRWGVLRDLKAKPKFSRWGVLRDLKDKPKFSRWGVLRDHLKAKCQISKPRSSDKKKVNDGGTNRTDVRDTAVLLRNWIVSDLKFIHKTSKSVEKYKNEIEAASTKLDELKNGGSLDSLRELHNTVTKLKQQIFFKEKDESNERRSAPVRKGNADKSLNEMPNLYKDAMLECSSAFQDLKLLYDSLNTELKLCLLCFSAFPENAIIKKRFMVYWWIGEGFIRVRAMPTPGSEKTVEELGNEFFTKLMVKGFIEPFYEKRSLEVHSCKMHPFVRSAVIMLAEKAKFFDFDPKGNVTWELSRSLRVCLLSKGLKIQDWEHVHTVFNVDEPFIEFKPEWFLRMININVLSLGKWQASGTDHIEVVSSKFLDGLSKMKHLRLFSLRGVSKIRVIPESISQLRHLMILDLRACHNLEAIPDDIGLLKSLTHLDMSGCFLLDQMPMGLASLSELQVLKGFLVDEPEGRNSCTLVDLAELRNLKKLTLYSRLEDFPKDTDLGAFGNFKVLTKLTILWVGRSLKDETAKSAEQEKDAAKLTAPVNMNTEKKDSWYKKAKQDSGAMNSKKGNSTVAPETVLPPQLEKLDLQCYPKTISPIWLKPANLKGLKKLYIRAGKFSDLGQFQNNGNYLTWVIFNKWNVEVLRLKYLNELEMDWRELLELFPKLIYLEKVNCPKLSFFPCDERGVWINRTKKQSQETAS